jgi:hypothetical protein
MVVDVVAVHTDMPGYYQALWSGEKDEAPLIYPDAIGASRTLGGLRRLWLKIDATPYEYLAWEEIMVHWLKGNNIYKVHSHYRAINVCKLNVVKPHHLNSFYPSDFKYMVIRYAS